MDNKLMCMYRYYFIRKIYAHISFLGMHKNPLLVRLLIAHPPGFLKLVDCTQVRIVGTFLFGVLLGPSSTHKGFQWPFSRKKHGHITGMTYIIV